MKLLLSFFKAPPAVKLEIAPNVLAALMEKGELHATDFRCLDLGSKQIVWQMLLSLAMSKIVEARGNCKPGEKTRPAP
ncbi:hypothetical protein NP590_15075 [Methylomonas sp. SURF-2]|uniref:Uncharacterized protein n=1 Tax=Methylomonas subterranea TaxID=2952225 RepID=A0ABT1TJ12_9GAMM|nr:hypothetical protein [Methylomonas sp. SURF-2]MCQ8105435.1 hypothetical protein [Methylomonas sp. SURF-2]